jgi:hypothetical protein
MVLSVKTSNKKPRITKQHKSAIKNINTWVKSLFSKIVNWDFSRGITPSGKLIMMLPQSRESSLCSNFSVKELEKREKDNGDISLPQTC